MQRDWRSEIQQRWAEDFKEIGLVSQHISSALDIFGSG